MRRYAEPIEVQVTSAEVDSAQGPDRPTAFLWRHRLFVVREIHGHWRERRAWWRDLGADRPEPASERHVWRVEASPGRVRPPGVFDLGSESPQGPWFLLCSHD